MLGGLAALVLASAGLVALAPSAGSAPQTFTSNGTFTVPAGVCQVTIAAWGGAGANSAANGGAGGRIQAGIPVTAGDVLDVTVGKTPSSQLVGGTGFNTGGTAQGNTGGGGGSSAVEHGASLLILAGGGGGAGAEGDGGAGGVAVSDLDHGSGSAAPFGGTAGGTADGTPNNGGNGSGGNAGPAPTRATGEQGAAGRAGAVAATRRPAPTSPIPVRTPTPPTAR
jgi:hypothetical protein